MTGSDLYQRIASRAFLRDAWSGTPWMIEAYTGEIDLCGRYLEVVEWCAREFGPEAGALHGTPGRWRAGNVTSFGWTWMGFETEEMMRRFAERWPAPARTEEVAK